MGRFLLYKAGMRVGRRVFAWAPRVPILGGVLLCACVGEKSTPDHPRAISNDQASLGYSVFWPELQDYVFLGWRLELGRTGDLKTDPHPDLALATGGKHSLGPVFVYKDRAGSDRANIAFNAIHESDGRYPEWLLASPGFWSQVHFAEADPRAPGTELLVSSYGGFLADSGLYAWQLRPKSQSYGPTRLAKGSIMDFDAADVDGDGQLEVAIAFDQIYPEKVPDTKRNLQRTRRKIEVSLTEPRSGKGVRLAALRPEGSSLTTLAFIQAKFVSPGRRTAAVAEPGTVRFFDVDGDGRLELLFSAAGHSVVVVDWQEVQDALETSDSNSVELECDGSTQSGVSCSPIGMYAVGLEAMKLDDGVTLVGALACYPNHGAGLCTAGAAQIRRYIGFDELSPRRRETETVSLGSARSLTALAVGEGPNAQLLAFLGFGDVDPKTGLATGDGGLLGLEIEHETWSTLTRDDAVVLPMDIELLPAASQPRCEILEMSVAGPHLTLPGPGPHQVTGVRVPPPGATTCEAPQLIEMCRNIGERDCWRHEPRSRSIQLPPAVRDCAVVEVCDYPVPVLAVADARPRPGGGVVLFYPPEYPVPNQ